MGLAKALVLGLGSSGFSSASYLCGAGWEVLVLDTRESPGLLPRLLKEVPGARFQGGSMPVSAIEGCSLVVISPGLSPEFSEAAPIVREAGRRGIEVVGEIELFARELARLKQEKGYAPRIVGITGTNGKTTTTALTARMLNAAGLSAVAAGNIGPNALAELVRHDREGTLPRVWVLELSSFQLQTTSSLRCDAAVITNVTQDHLDWHGGFDPYVQAKRRIFRPGTVQVLNRDDPLSLGSALKGETVRTFGGSSPAREGEWGITESEGLKWLSVFGQRQAPELLMPMRALKIRGTHNAMNALTSLALAESAGAELAPCLAALRDYAGEPHRTQWVLSVSGIDFIDDSKGTDVGATAAGLQGFGESGQKSVVILGGDGKGQDFSPLEPYVRKWARAVVTFGRDGDKIACAVREAGVPMAKAGDLPEATRTAFSMARAGDAVLLSPACASWDMFPNYGVRAQVFRDAAKEISEEVNGK